MLTAVIVAQIKSRFYAHTDSLGPNSKEFSLSRCLMIDP